MAGMEDIWSAVTQGTTTLLNVGNQYQQYKIQEAQAKALRGVVASNPTQPLPTLLPGGKGYVPTTTASVWSGNAPLIALGIGAAFALFMATRGRRGR